MIFNIDPLVVDNIVKGVYSDWIFTDLAPKAVIAIKNNFLVLYIFAKLFQKITKFTKFTWDDKLSQAFMNLLLRFKSKPIGDINKPHKKKEGDQNEKKIKVL